MDENNNNKESFFQKVKTDKKYKAKVELLGYVVVIVLIIIQKLYQIYIINIIKINNGLLFYTKCKIEVQKPQERSVNDSSFLRWKL